MKQQTFLKILGFSAIILLLVSFFSCSTKKNTFTRRLYHNLNSHYNGYFNGRESYKEGVNKVWAMHEDNYRKILPVYKLGDDNVAQSVYPQMDRAIQKGSLMISRHSIYIRRKEHIRWIDDCYLLIGKAQFYKQDYLVAGLTFDYITKRFQKEPASDEAKLWLAKIANINGDFQTSKEFLSFLKTRDRRGLLKNNVRKELPMAYADLYLKQENLLDALPQLKKAYDVNTSKKIRTRLAYIIAQIYQETGNGKKAAEYYTKVIKMNPPYEMAFNAKINLAMVYEANMSGGKDIKKVLGKMLKDEKNKEYLDKVYYALAHVAMKEKDTLTGIQYLRRSVALSMGDNYQKTISALELADIYFFRQDYENAQAYYDSTMSFLPQNFPNYKEIKRKHEVLGDLVKNLQVIQLEDSLQQLAAMSETERMAIIDKIISDIAEEEQRRRQEETERIQDLNVLTQNNASRRTSTTGEGTGSQWYFYNTSAISFGRSEFMKKWGKRKLEDLWRLSNKQLSAEFEFAEGLNEPDDTSGVDEEGEIAINPKDRNTYLKDIPLTEKQMEASNLKVQEALFNVGNIYKEGLADFNKSIESFDKLLTRYPDNDYQLRAYYQLYKIYQQLGNIDKTAYYKSLILGRYPDSDYARVLENPEYFRLIEAKRNEAEAFYSLTYTAYTEGKFSTVIENSDTATAKYKDGNALARFEYLKAMSVGKTKSRQEFEDALKQVVNSYPESDVKPLAQNIIDYMNRPVDEEPDKEGTGETETDVTGTSEAQYSYNPAQAHFYVMIVNVHNVKVGELKILFSDHNLTNFSLNKLNVSSVYLDNQRQIITISTFENMEKAMIYFNTVKNSTTINSKVKPGDFEHFVINSNDYAKFYKDKDVQKYLDFFQSNYLNK